MTGALQELWQRLVPEPEAAELLRLSLVVGGTAEINLNDYGARRDLERLFVTLDSLHHAGRRLRDQALGDLVSVLPARTTAYGSIQELAQIAQVPLLHVDSIARRIEAAAED